MTLFLIPNIPTFGVPKKQILGVGILDKFLVDEMKVEIKKTT